MSSHSDLDEEKAYEITLSGDAWRDEDVSEDFYFAKLEHLKRGYTELLLKNTVETLETYYRRVRRDNSIISFNTELYDILMAEGVLLWNEFAKNRLKHWCEYKNESLVNIIFLSSNLYFESLDEFEQGLKQAEISVQMQRDRLEKFLTFVLDTFFIDHEMEFQNMGRNECQRHILGLTDFYVRNTDGEEESLSIQVPYPIHMFKTPREFQDAMDNIIEGSVTMFKALFADEVYRPISVAYDGIKDISNPSIPIQWFPKERNIDRHFRLQMNALTLLETLIFSETYSSMLSYQRLRINDDHVNWCILMVDELIVQVYAAVNAIMSVWCMYWSKKESAHDRDRARVMRNLPRYLDKKITEVCINFFKINCKTWHDSRVMRNKNQWSGKWGIKMYFEQNFRRVDEKLYIRQYPQDNVRGPSDFFYYKLPYPVLTLKDARERNLAVAMLSHKDLSVLGPESTSSVRNPRQNRSESVRRRSAAETQQLKAIHDLRLTLPPELWSEIARLSLYQDEPRQVPPQL